MQRISKFRNTKIEKIEEEEDDEANSSVIKSVEVEEKLEVEVLEEKVERKSSIDLKRNSMNAYDLRHHSEAHGELPEQRSRRARHKSNSFHQHPIEENSNGKPVYQIYPKEAQESAVAEKNIDKQNPKKSISNRKMDGMNSYKTSSVSVLHMLQNKTFNLIKGVNSKGRKQSQRNCRVQR